MRKYIQKVKRECKCWRCNKKISGKYMLVYNQCRYHLNCYYAWLELRLQELKNIKREFTPTMRRQMLLEVLER